MALQSCTREQVTVGDSVETLTAATIIATTYDVIMAIIAVTNAPIRITFDGTDPTTTLGLPFEAGDMFEVWGQPDLLGLEMIRSGGVDAVVEVEYFGAHVG